MSRSIIRNMPKVVINKWLFFNQKKKKKKPRVIIQPGNWPCFPLSLLSLSFKRHHSCHPQLLYSQLAPMGPLLTTARLALPTWLASAVCQGRCAWFLGIFRESHVQMHRVVRGKLWAARTPLHWREVCTAEILWISSSPRARTCLAIRKLSLLLERVGCNFGDRHGTLLKPFNSGSLL